MNLVKGSLTSNKVAAAATTTFPNIFSDVRQKKTC